MDEPVSLLEHLAELRKRILYSIIAVIICSVSVYPFIEKVLTHLILTSQAGKLVFMSPVEAFGARLELTLFLGLLISTPLVFFQIWRFVQKGLIPKEKKSALLLFFVSFTLFIIGASFGYFLILPVGMKFLLASGSATLVPMISVSRYLSFVFFLIFAFGVTFELPLILGFLTKIGLLDSLTLRKQRRLAIVLIFIVAAVATPGPDVLSQVLMAGALLALYEIGIVVSRLIERRRE